MTITVEDGTLVTGANSYVTSQELVDYAEARGTTILLADAEELLIKAMDYLESLIYKGVKRRYDQALQWPRADVYIDDYLVYVDEIPTELKKAQYETALAINRGEDPLADIPKTIQKASVGSISVEYSQGSSINTVRKISAYLHKLISGAGSGVNFTVDRG